MHAIDLNTYDNGMAQLQLALWTDPDSTLAPAPGSGDADQSLATRLATAPGLVRAGASRWDGGRTPIHPLSVESAYADPQLLRDLGARGARFARDLGVFVLVDMREVADTLTSVAAALPTESVSTYLQVLTLAAANGVLDPTVHKLSVDAIVNRLTDEDPRWDLLPMAA